jgi:dihydrofolate reductase
MEVIIIVNASENNAIGLNNNLLYKISDDLRRFKEFTMNNCIIMGKNTYKSIGNTPLKNRLNIVVTSNNDLDVYDNLKVSKSVLEAIEMAKNDGFEKIYLIGGTQIFREGLDMGMVDKIYLTRVYDSPVADTYLPEFEDDFIIESQSSLIPDMDLKLNYRFINYIKK